MNSRAFVAAMLDPAERKRLLASIFQSAAPPAEARWTKRVWDGTKYVDAPAEPESECERLRRLA